jgi:hypothetical protein
MSKDTYRTTYTKYRDEDFLNELDNSADYAKEQV